MLQREKKLRAQSRAFTALRRKHRKNETDITVKSVVHDAKTANTLMAVRDQVIATMEKRTPHDALAFINKNSNTRAVVPRSVEPRKPRDEAITSANKAACERILHGSSIHSCVVLC
jgi:hypothetical protein